MKKCLLFCVAACFWYAAAAQFSNSATDWDVPNGFENSYNSGLANGQGHSTFDINGDGLPDLIDGFDNANNGVWISSAISRYWKVYLNTGTGFSNTATEWDVPNGFENSFNSGLANGQGHSTRDLTGDGLPDLIDGFDNANNGVWISSAISRYWKVYINTGSGFRNTAYEWDVPNGFDNGYNSGLASGPTHTTLDLDGDGQPDLIDGFDNANNGVWISSAISRYWQVYLNPFVGLEDAIVEDDLLVYPQPASDWVRVVFPEGITGQRISVFDVAGKMIQEQSSPGQEAVQLDASTLPAGLYLLQARGQDLAGRPYVSSQKFLVRQ